MTAGQSRRSPSGFLRYAARNVLPILAALIVQSCGGDGSPSNGPTAPTLAAPADDAAAEPPVTLTVHNASSTGAGARSYEFQVADSETALTGASAALIAAGTVGEGSGGTTSFVVSPALAAGRRYYWRSRASQGGTPGAWSGTFRFRVSVPANPPPIIQTLGPTSNRVEANAELAFNALVQDAETNPASLVYEWTAAAGTFTGSGAAVRWRAPDTPSAAPYDVTLTVIERYTVSDPDGRPETRENRSTASTTIRVNNSPRELTTLAMTFVDDFVHSDRSPEYCVRNFSDSCSGKQEELSDITANRQKYIIYPEQSSYTLHSINFNTPGSVPTAATQSTVRVRCRFANTEKATGKFEIVTGTCRLEAIYENWQWRLCESRFDAPLPAHFKGRFLN
jgi:hypothetical protein